MRDPKVHKEVIERVASYAIEIGFALQHLDYSPIKGPEGNIEYLLHLKNDAAVSALSDIDIDGVVAAAHRQLDKGV